MDPEEHEQRREQEQTVYTVRRAEEGGVPESESHDMIDAALYVGTNRSITELFSQIEQRVDHITQLHIQLRERLHHMDESQKVMYEKINYLIGNQRVQFSCADSMISFGSKFTIGEVETEQGHNNSSNGSKGGIAIKEILKRRRGQWIPSKFNETELKPTAKSPDTVSPYYTQFQQRIRNEPAAAHLGANAGLKNSNVNCYSNAIFQCIASCICYSDFSPSEKHPQFPLNHAFASLMSSVVGSEESVDPSLFMNDFMHLFRPQGEENINQQEGMYYDYA